MKKRTLGLIIAGVASASMIGTGFAAWVITGNATGTLDGSIQVDTVTDKSIALDVNWKNDEDGKINFLGPETQNASNEWLAYEEDSTNPYNEDLSETLVLTFDLGENVTKSEFEVTFKFEVGATYAADYQAAIDAKFINTPTINGQALDAQGEYSCGLDALLGSGTEAEVALAFTWGAAFNNLNPYTFYNGIAYGTKVKKNAAGTPEASDANDAVTIQSIAKADLTALNDDLNNVGFQLTITVEKI